MTNVDMTKKASRPLTPGIDLWEIMEAKDGKSKSKNESLLNLKFFRVAKRNDHIYDSVMLEGDGWPMGQKKLGALLPPDFNGDLDPLSLVGKRLWLATSVQTYNGNDSLKVNPKGGLKFAGYQPAADVPAGCTTPVEEPLGDDVPF